MKKDLEKIIKDLLKHLEIKPLEIAVEKDDNDTYQLNLKLEEQDTGILIGYHGDTITSLQLVLGLLLYKQTGSWTRVILNIGDYREKRSESLKKTAEDTVHRVKFSGEPIALFNLNPFERREIHMHLSDHPEVVTESQGEGRNRHLIVKLKEGLEPPPPTDEQPAS